MIVTETIEIRDHITPHTHKPEVLLDTKVYTISSHINSISQATKAVERACQGCIQKFCQGGGGGGGGKFGVRTKEGGRSLYEVLHHILAGGGGGGGGGQMPLPAPLKYSPACNKQTSKS